VRRQRVPQNENDAALRKHGHDRLDHDVGLRRDHKRRYDPFRRWIIAAAVMGGGALAGMTRLSDLAIGLLFAFLAGGIVLNVLKEELPEERESRFLPSLAGAIGCSLGLAAI